MNLDIGSPLGLQYRAGTVSDQFCLSTADQTHLGRNVQRRVPLVDTVTQLDPVARG